MTEYWPWWLGGIALGLVTVIYGLLIRKPLGVSGSWSRVASWYEDKHMRQGAEVMQQGSDEVANDLLAATLAEFGESAAAEISPGKRSSRQVKSSTQKNEFIPWTVHLVFLLFMFIGSLLTAIYDGHLSFSLELSALHTEIFGTSTEVWLSLFFGGVMVGFGTQMAGGCTSGHGLSGCSQLVPASIVATVVFFLSASALSFLMEIATKV